MSLPRKGTRTLEVDGVRYRWLVRRKPTYGQAVGDSGLSVAVELEHPGATMVVKLDANRPDAWVNSSEVSVTPADVVEFIRVGLGYGWDPSADGPTFILRFTESAVSDCRREQQTTDAAR